MADETILTSSARSLWMSMFFVMLAELSEGVQTSTVLRRLFLSKSSPEQIQEGRKRYSFQQIKSKLNGLHDLQMWWHGPTIQKLTEGNGL